jgi:hypothetical protein
MPSFLPHVEKAIEETMSVDHESEKGKLAFFAAVLGANLFYKKIRNMTPSDISGFCKFFNLTKDLQKSNTTNRRKV